MASRRNDGAVAEHHRLPGSGREAGAVDAPPEQNKLLVRAFADAVNARNWARVLGKCPEFGAPAALIPPEVVTGSSRRLSVAE